MPSTPHIVMIQWLMTQLEDAKETGDRNYENEKDGDLVGGDGDVDGDGDGDGDDGAGVTVYC